ncbi:MAG: serine/threonine protein kinase [Deltaproteobacteria bacterium]|nr:serine/threonine protein kinase [Deltaproteobacteria bacterium]
MPKELKDLKRLDALFDQALDLPVEERAAFARSALGEEPALLGSLMDLLDCAEAEAPENDLDEGGGLREKVLEAAWAELSDRPAGLEEGTQLGPYQLLEEIGRGGMAVVYRAQRVDQTFVRQVAIKVLELDLRKETRDRFEQERQILATLSHPNLATVYDAGVTAGNQPYLVMELVEGEPIDRYCNRRSHPLKERLQLILEVIAAVDHAHRHLVVHRDLKPSNILVTGKGRVKLLDFGIAKLLRDEAMAIDIPSVVPETRSVMRVLTPEFASPEQILGKPITTASDVYQLGLLLFLLLTGERAGNGIDLVEQISSRAPGRIFPRPSGVAKIKASEAAHEAPGVRISGLDQPKLRRQLAGDLDAIVLKALRPEPEERFGSVTDLARDLNAFLEGRAVAARTGNRRYRLRKFVHRHLFDLAAAAVVLIVLAGLIGGFTLRLQEERNLARREAERAQQVTHFMRGLFEARRPLDSAAEAAVAEKILDRGVRRAEDELGDQPELYAAVMEMIGESYSSLGVQDEALRLLEAALRQKKETYGADHVATAKAMTAVGRHHIRCWEPERALVSLRGAQRILLAQEDAGDEEMAQVLSSLGVVLLLMDRQAEAEGPLREALLRTQRFFGPTDEKVVRPAGSLARTLHQLGQHQEAREIRELELSILERQYGATSPFFAGSLCQLILLLLDGGLVDDAAEHIDRLLFALEAGPSVANGGIARQALAALLADQGASLLALGEGSWGVFDRLWVQLEESEIYGEATTGDLLREAAGAALGDGQQGRVEALRDLLAVWERQAGSE